MRTDTSRAAAAPAPTSSESFLPMSCARPPIGRPTCHLLARVGCSPAEARSSRRHRCPSPRSLGRAHSCRGSRPRRLSVRPVAAARGQAMATRARRPDALRRSGRLPAAARGDRRVSGRGARRALRRRPGDRRGRARSRRSTWRRALLLDPGDAVWIEDPGYLGARGALLARGARLVPVPVDDEGLDVAAGRRRSRRTRGSST